MKIILFTMLLGLFIFTGCTSEQQTESKDSNEVVEEKNTDRIDFENAVFVDVRTPGEFESGSFEKAINIPLNELKARNSEIPQSNQIVVFCKSGARASKAMQLLQDEGYKNVINGVNASQLKSLQNK